MLVLSDRQRHRFQRVFIDDSESVLAKKIVLTKPMALLIHGWLDQFDSLFLRNKGKGTHLHHSLRREELRHTKTYRRTQY